LCPPQRLVSWNCCEGFERDLTHLRQLGCDVVVLAEVPRAAPNQTIVDPNVDWHWSGEYERNALALAGFGTMLSPLEPQPDAGTSCVAARPGSSSGYSASGPALARVRRESAGSAAA